MAHCEEGTSGEEAPERKARGSCYRGWLVKPFGYVAGQEGGDSMRHRGCCNFIHCQTRHKGWSTGAPRRVCSDLEKGPTLDEGMVRKGVGANDL